MKFFVNGWTWRVGGELIVPSEDDIAKTLDRMKEVLYTEPDGTQMELGRLIMRKDAEGYEVYVYLGDYAPNGDYDEQTG